MLAALSPGCPPNFPLTPPNMNRASEFYALLARAYADWDVRNNDMPALEADQFCVAGRHHLESVSLHTIGAAHVMHRISLYQPEAVSEGWRC